MSSSGFLIYKSHCSCTGNEKVSLFVNQEICETHSVETERSCCSVKTEDECTTNSTDCDCDKPEITYFKLQNKVLNEEVKFLKIYPVEILVALTTIQFNLWELEKTPETGFQDVDPPPIHTTSLDFLIQIHQLKIPSFA